MSYFFLMWRLPFTFLIPFFFLCCPFSEFSLLIRWLILLVSKVGHIIQHYGLTFERVHSAFLVNLLKCLNFRAGWRETTVIRWEWSQINMTWSSRSHLVESASFIGQQFKDFIFSMIKIIIPIVLGANL